MADSNIPEELRYTAEHEWVVKVDETTVRVGITDYAQDQLGDVVFVQLPGAGDAVASGDSFAEVESTKSVSDIYSPLEGEVVAVNDALEASPDLVNSDPYGAGWLAELRVASGTADDLLAGLLDAAAYRAQTAG
ncbi:glycine cleavage system H protein [Gordonia araii NBRC 100433]|uniref:Glycine cleavage system H protein n=1 Tax=Gordonia araii NBRC 100433 TaxID=1073574 RepID=G7H0Q9_9ACTN|nr:glycine cleavage system protein GcvH [Gordonia araii]NNG96803.1 glycine cleavage system protein GcvH [Gordonia araii NBRC 100433]GAB09434.1 glycine cleavage system H protein [Gordonia araii NBRC 100433]